MNTWPRYRNLENVQVAAVCDLSAARAEATAERFGILKWGLDYKSLIDDVRPDLVHITTPPTSHFSIAKNCLAAGCNLLCEKPITQSYEEFGILKGLAIENDRLLLENQNYRFHSFNSENSRSYKCGRTRRDCRCADFSVTEYCRRWEPIRGSERVIFWSGIAWRINRRLSYPHCLSLPHFYGVGH